MNVGELELNRVTDNSIKLFSDRGNEDIKKLYTIKTRNLKNIDMIKVDSTSILK